MTTIKQAKAECRALGFKLAKTDYDEWRLAPMLCTAETEERRASYHSELDDALSTAKWEHARRNSARHLAQRDIDERINR